MIKGSVGTKCVVVDLMIFCFISSIVSINFDKVGGKSESYEVFVLI